MRIEPVTEAAAEETEANGADVVQLPALTVTGSTTQPSGYYVERSFGATKTNTPLIETPMSVQVVPQEIIEDRQYTSVLDAMENVSGVVAVPSLSIGSRYLIRGFDQDEIYRNGLISNGLNARFPSSYDTATIERIEVIKGPASVLYGRIEPGGFINIVTKKPLLFYYHNAEVQLGSFDYSRAVVDSTGPIDKDGKWLYRIIEHQILLGFAYLRGRTHYAINGGFLNPNPALAIDIFNPGPSYGIDPALFETSLATSVFPKNHAVFKDHDFGIYFQDHITIWENLSTYAKVIRYSSPKLASIYSSASLRWR